MGEQTNTCMREVRAVEEERGANINPRADMQRPGATCCLTSVADRTHTSSP